MELISREEICLLQLNRNRICAATASSDAGTSIANKTCNEHGTAVPILMRRRTETLGSVTVDQPRGQSCTATDMPTATDTAHAMAECSNRGECDHSTGQCVCHSGFGGDACQRLSCASDCNGHGRCQSLEQYAGTTYNDDSVQYAYTGVWDADKTFGCVCDWPYMGHDCAQKGCPVGDDPLTTGQVNEAQLLYCVARSSGDYTEKRCSREGEMGCQAGWLASWFQPPQPTPF